MVDAIEPLGGMKAITKKIGRELLKQNLPEKEPETPFYLQLEAARKELIEVKRRIKTLECSGNVSLDAKKQIPNPETRINLMALKAIEKERETYLLDNGVDPKLVGLNLLG